jgi:hypothetical protein
MKFLWLTLDSLSIYTEGRIIDDELVLKDIFYSQVLCVENKMLLDTNLFLEACFRTPGPVFARRYGSGDNTNLNPA